MWGTSAVMAMRMGLVEETLENDRFKNTDDFECVCVLEHSFSLILLIVIRIKEPSVRVFSLCGCPPIATRLMNVDCPSKN
jgi:hypothetical protein